MASDTHLESALDAYFAHLTASFDARVRAGGAVAPRRYRIAGQRIALRCAGARLEPFLLPGLQHLADTTGGEVALDIAVLAADADERELTLPAVLRSAAAATPVGTAHESTASPVYTYLGRRYLMTWLTAAAHTEVSLLDIERGRAVVVLLNDAGLPSLPASAPLRSLLAMWFEHHGMLLVHAAAVGTELGGVLIAAKSGGGKSTIALACLGTALRCAGDDSLLVEMGEGPVRGHSLYCSGSVFSADVDRYPPLRGLPLQPRLDRPKQQFFLGDAPAWLIDTVAVRAILVPTFTERPFSRVTPAAPSQALLTLGPSSINLAGGRPAQRLARIAALARTLPCFTLQLGRRTADVPAVIQDLLTSLSAAPAA